MRLCWRAGLLEQRGRRGEILHRLLTLFVLGELALASGQQLEQTASPVMIAAVSRDSIGGLGPSRRTKSGAVEAEPLAFLLPSGEWQALPCKPGTGEGCKKFAREYLSKNHTYTVISADGMGATIHTSPVTLSECFGYSGDGTYSGGRIERSAIATGSPDLFDTANRPGIVTPSEAAAIRRALRPLVPKRLDTVEDLRLMHLQLEGMDLLIVQRAYADNIDPKNFTRKYVFMIGRIEEGQFHVLQRKKTMDDEEERVLGTIRMKNGKEFLITTVSDPESQSFRIYGVRDGHVALVFQGGGSSC
jgi:hypothetical protein